MFSDDKPAPQSLLSPRSVDEFLSDYWPDKALYFAVDGDPARPPEFLHAKALTTLDSLAHINQRDTPFYARDLQAQFPEIAFDEIKQLLENCARCGLMTLLCFPSINNNKN
jgi:hypothetical protein